MTDDTQSRLDRIEQLVQANAEQTNRNAELLNQFTNVLSQTIQVTVDNANAIGQVTQRVNSNAQAIDRLTQAVAADRDRFAEHQRTTEAALSKIDRVLDYLMQQGTNDG